jgi:N-acetylneuraminic acid mutarotase
VIPDGITDAGDIVLRPGLSGDWTARAALPTSRGALTAVTLGDGIHVLGGDVNWNGSSPFNVHEVYDPASDTWSTRAVVPDSNTWSARAAVVGEKIYLLGGWPGGSNLNREYDPERNEWTYKAPIPAIFTWGHAVAALGNEIVVIGGTCGFCVQIYDAAQDSWRQGASIPGNRASLAAAAIGERIYVAGTGAQLQIYDPAADEWTTGADLPVSTHAPSAAVFVDKLYLFGGSSSDPGSGGNLSAVQVYDPVEDRWEELPSMPTPRSWSAAAAVEDAIHVFGGFNTANTRIDVHERMR